jgi:ferrochelatase
VSVTGKTAVLLLAHGSPDKPEDVPEFLLKVTGGRPLPPAAVEEITHRYARIQRSPLTEITLRQGEELARVLGMKVSVGMRNWKPYIADACARLASEQVERAVAICLAPHDSRTSVGLYRKAAEEGAAAHRLTLDFVDAWHDHPLLVRAFGERLLEGWPRACAESGVRLPVIFTAHSVPERTIAEGDPYATQARETAELVAAEAGLPRDLWRFAFQSQGMSGGPWLGPTVEETILELKQQGHRGVFVQPIGFVCDHVEVLYDVDIAFREFAAEQGMRLWRAESLNDSPTFISALADVARQRIFVR